MKNKLTVKNLFELAWADYKTNFISWLLLLLKMLGMGLLIVFGTGLLVAVGLALSSTFVGVVGIAIMVSAILGVVVLGSAITAVYINNALDVVHGRQMRDIHWPSRVFSFTVALVLLMIGLVVGYASLVVPGIYLSIRWSLMQYYLMDKKSSVTEAFAASWNMTRGHSWFIFKIGFILFILSSIAHLTVIGSFIYPPFSLLLYAHLYKILVSNKAGQIESLLD